MDNIQKYFIPEEIKPELKKEHELNVNDRVHLINKKIDENFLIETYENLVDKKQYVFTKNESNISININLSTSKF